MRRTSTRPSRLSCASSSNRRSRAIAPDISILLRDRGDARLRDRALEAFARSTLPAPRAEFIGVDEHAHATIGAARAAAVTQATAPIVLFFDAACWPLPGLLHYCLDFHRSHPDREDALLVGVTSDVTLRRNALHHWLRSSSRFPGEPPAPGVYAWTHFTARVLSCRRSLLALAPFDLRFQAGEDVQLASRLTRLTPLKVWYEQLPLAVFSGPVTLDAAMRDEYLDGYFRRVRVHEDDRARMLSDVDDRFAFAERFVVGDGERATLLATIEQVRATLEDVEPAFAAGDEAERIDLLHRMFDTLFADAAARGWLDAERALRLL